MQNVQWYVSRIEGIDPDDTSPDPARRVSVKAQYESADFGGYIASHDFEVVVSAALRGLDAIELEAYRQLREHLAVLASTIPGGRSGRSIA
jgi:hypothetical protein